MEINNTPPFYVGQKIVCIKTHSERLVVEKQKYTVLRCYIHCCGGWAVEVKEVLSTMKDNSVSKVGEIRICYTRKHRSISTGFHPLSALLFAPIQQTKFPLMSFSKITEVEKEEILINN